MASFTLAPVKYGKVVGRFLAESGDGADSDPYPDATPLTGTVTFTPSVKKVLVTSGQPDPATVELMPVIGTIDSNGYLSFNNALGVWLVATNDSATNPTNFTYTVTYNLTYAGVIVDKSVFSIQVPAANASDPTTFTDLAVVAPVPSSTGDAIVKGDPGATTSLQIGSVTSGSSAAASITGTAPTQYLNLVIPSGGSGGGGGTGTVKSVNTVNPDLAGNVTLGATDVSAVPSAAVGAASGVASLDSSGKIPIGQVPAIDYARAAPWTTFDVRPVSGVWPARPSARTDLVFVWTGPDPSPAIVTSGTGGMLADVDKRDVVYP